MARIEVEIDDKFVEPGEWIYEYRLPAIGEIYLNSYSLDWRMATASSNCALVRIPKPAESPEPLTPGISVPEAFCVNAELIRAINGTIEAMSGVMDSFVGRGYSDEISEMLLQIAALGKTVEELGRKP